jgi:hypothetical protein
LTPRVVNAAGVNRVKAQRIHQVHDYLLGDRIVARHGQRHSVARAHRSRPFEKIGGVNPVESLDDRMTDLLRYPSALRQSLLDSANATVSLLGVVVTRVDYHYPGVGPVEETMGQVYDVLLGDRDHHQVGSHRRLGGEGRASARLFHELLECLGAS